ncbi:hypothetical protein PG996_000545 [Apiospora saccharicola]|uniref:Rhodopsin domain-containing protein n=1 Tax=Apiospora saccharicola TaxID=335842 RepID=A0ABR1WE18_9PEZI
MAPEDRSPELYASTIFGLTIATVTVALRCYVRLCMLKIFSWEDYLAVVSLVRLPTHLLIQDALPCRREADPIQIFFGGYGSCVFLSIQYGAGKHLEKVPPEWLPNALKVSPVHPTSYAQEDVRTDQVEQYRWLGEWIYVVTSIMIKITVSILLLRICSKPWHKAVIYTTIAVVVIWNTIYTFLAAFQCVPVQHFWDRLSDPDGGSCLNEEIITGTTYAAAAINCLADWILGLLPIALVWSLELNRRTKASIAGILALGIIASAATIVRIPYVWQLTHDSDFLYVFVDFTTWSTTELAMGLAASSIATLRPLFKKGLGGTSGTGSRRSPGRDRRGGAVAAAKRASTKFSGIKGLVIHRRDEISMGTPMPITPTTAVYTTRRNSVSSATVDVERYAVAPWERGLGNEEWKVGSGGSPVSVRGGV